MAPLLIDHGCRSSRRVALLGKAAFSSKVAHLSIVEAWKVAGGKLVWWPDGSLLQQWSRGMVELPLLLLLRLLLLELPRLELWAMAPLRLLLWSTQLTPRWGIHHAVHGRSTTRTTAASRSRHHPLPLFSNRPQQQPSSSFLGRWLHVPTRCTTSWRYVPGSPTDGW
jgi:hypothetical protein